MPGAPTLPYYALAQEIAAYEGQPVVSVVATSRHVAEDALELIDVDYEPLPARRGRARGRSSRTRRCCTPDMLDTNLLAVEPAVGAATPRRALAARATSCVEGRFRINRVTGLPMETARRSSPSGAPARAS